MATPPTYDPHMDCSVVHDALQRGVFDDAAASAHAEVCPACAELWADGAELGQVLAAAAPVADGTAWREQLERTLAAESGRTPARWSTRARATLLAVGGVGLCAVVWWLQPRDDWAMVSPGHMAVVVGGLWGVGLLGISWALRPLHKPELAGWQRRLSLGGLALGPLALMALPSGHQHLPGDELSALVVCAGVASAFGLAGVGVLRALDRRARASWSRAAGYAALGAVLGNLYLQLHCPYTGALHTIVAHGAVGLAWMVALSLVGRVRD